MVLPIVDITGKEVGQREVADYVFGIQPHRAVMHQALVRQQANARVGSHKTQSRGEVDRTSRKWYRQKGTGRARHGSRTASLFVGGAVAHGPRPRSYTQSMPRKMRRLAVRSALSARAAEGAVILVDGLTTMDTPRTRGAVEMLDELVGGASSLVILPGADPTLERSVRNVPGVRYLRANYMNVRDLLGFEKVVIPLVALEVIEAMLTVGATHASPGRGRRATGAGAADGQED